MAIIYSVVGVKPVVVMLLLSLAFSALPKIVRATAKNFGLESCGNFAVIMTIFTPQILIWNSFLQREGLSFITLALLLYLLSDSKKHNSLIKNWYWYLTLIFIAYHIRAQIIISVGFSMFITSILLVYSSSKINGLKPLGKLGICSLRYLSLVDQF